MCCSWALYETYRNWIYEENGAEKSRMQLNAGAQRNVSLEPNRHKRGRTTYEEKWY